MPNFHRFAILPLFILCCAFLLPLQTRAAAPVGTSFSYQGQLKQSGALVSGNYDFEFRLFNAATGGIQYGPTLSRPNTTLNGGTFNVALDFGGMNYSSSAMYLQISVRRSGSGDYAILSPRQQLQPAAASVQHRPLVEALVDEAIGGFAPEHGRVLNPGQQILFAGFARRAMRRA